MNFLLIYSNLEKTLPLVYIWVSGGFFNIDS